MNKITKVKIITTIICLAISLVALYAFCFVIDVALSWRIVLIIISASWIISGIWNLIDYIKK